MLFAVSNFGKKIRKVENLSGTLFDAQGWSEDLQARNAKWALSAGA
jgi:hypothetical protein